MRGFVLAASVVVLGLASATIADSGPELAAKFGALESIQQISMSPNGNLVSFVAPVAGASALYISDLSLGGQPRPILRVSSSDGQLSFCDWVTDTRLTCSLRGAVSDGLQLIGYSRMIALDADGTNAVRLSSRTNTRSLGFMQHGGQVIDWDIREKPGAVLMTRDFIPEESTGTHIQHDEDGLGVEEVDSQTLRRRTVEQARRDAFDYISDGHGTVRIMGMQGHTDSGYLRDRVKYLYRRVGSRDWDDLSEQSASGERESGFTPLAVDSASNVVFGLDDHDGFDALYSISLDGTRTRNLVLSRPDVDIDSLITIGRDNRVVGASYATERRTTEFFDPALRSLSAALSRALPGNPSVSFIDASRDEAFLLVLVSSDTNPGMFYRYTKATRRLEELLPVRVELAGIPLAPMRPVSYAAADGTQIPAYLTLPPGSDGKNLPAIVMPHGGPGARDEWGFDWLVQYYAARGYAVLQPNFRGSTGYGSAWYQRNGFRSWRVAIGDVNDAGRWLVTQGIAAPDKLGIVGWSYGGYAALQTSVLDPDLFKAIVAIAPVTDLERLRQESAGYTNFPQVDQYIGNGPHVREGSPAQNVDRIKAPVLLFHGTRDQNVGVAESRLMADRLRDAGKQVTYVEFDDLAHSLSNAAARTRLLNESDAFLRRSMGISGN
jgi:dipeptidyl aminopeptidase/acylaminoacyl peptidase